MSSTDVTVHQPTQTVTLADQIEFAQLVTSGARSGSILPDAYRGNPANVVIAVGLGQAMGLSPAEALYRISVIKGKPTAGAELIAANVRRAGHKLRVTSSDDSATCTIIRADDPDFEHVVTRDLEWAKSMGLAGNDNYKRQLVTMLQWRAITACARLACPEALYGVTYTPDEAEGIPDERPVTDVPAKPHGMSALKAAVAQSVEAEVVDGEMVEHVAGDQVDEPAPPTKPSRSRRNLMFKLFDERRPDLKAREARLRYCGLIARRPVGGDEVTSSNDLTADEVETIIAALEDTPMPEDVGGLPEDGAQ